jgi:hypothetical protein
MMRDTQVVADYPLTQLGSTEFEHMAQALVAAELGPTVKIYGAGRDGGREGTTKATVGPLQGVTWTGYTVAQAKFRARHGEPADNAEWLRNEIRKELNAWTDKDRNRHPKPDNLLFITNVVLSAVPGRGLDYVESVVEDFAAQLPLSGFTIWHYDHVCRLLENNASVRTAFAGLITPGDVLMELHRTLVGEAVDIGQVMRRHAGMELRAEQWVRLGHAGSASNEKLPLAQVGVDLIAARRGPSEDTDIKAASLVPAIQHLLQVGDVVLRPSIRPNESPHVVLVGGPGQGKTTVGQLVCQIYRANLIEDANSLGPEAAAVVRTLRDHLADSSLPAPAMKRWPLRLDLSRYADVLAGDPDAPVLRFIADRVTDRVTETVTAPQMKSWLGSWPWLLVFDGFDEVVAAHVREALIERISDFLIEAASVDADLLVIATTRPQGYSGEFVSDHYEHLHLMPLNRRQALAFARKLADVRLNDDPDAHRNVMERIAEAADETMTARLMRTPLQVTIMSLLLEGRARVPQHRYGLFDAYYETLYNREVAKSTSTARLLEHHRRTVNELHERVGVRLQVQAEANGKADAALPHQEFETLARELLDKDEFPAPEAADLAAKIAEAATRRLVLLVPKNIDDVGFDVRSLQEFMAARAVTSGADGQVMIRLKQLALSAHWRNTWLLATGRIAAARSHLVDSVILLLDEIDTESYLSLYLAPASALALDLLDDKFAAPSPRVEKLLLKKAAEVLRRPPDLAVVQAADVLQRVSVDGESSGATGFISDIARQALAAEPPQKVTAALAMRRWTQSTGALAALGRQRVKHLQTALGPDKGAALANHFTSTTSKREGKQPARKGTLADHLRHDAGALAGADMRALDALLQELKKVEVRYIGETPVAAVPVAPAADQEVVEAALRRPEVADYIAGRLMALEPKDWAIASALGELIRRWSQQRPVGASALQ